MSSVAKQAARKVDFNKLVNGLGLTGTTASSLTAFKKRHDEAKKNLLIYQVNLLILISIIIDQF